jgi:hypothetical protein
MVSRSTRLRSSLTPEGRCCVLADEEIPRALLGVAILTDPEGPVLRVDWPAAKLSPHVVVILTDCGEPVLP